MLKVLNKYKDTIPDDAIWIGRPSKWGNQFSHQEGTKAKYKVKTRERAIDFHKNLVLANEGFIRIVKRELKGKDLVCVCAPLPCHGDILLELANE